MSPPLRLARKRLDLTWADLGYGLRCCALPPRRERALDRLAALWQPAGSVVACLSVRSGFDLLLACVDWPPGSEVLMSALTIPHMATLVRAHGYVPVAVDLDPETLELEAERLRAACSPRTRALVYAHLLGARADVGTLAALAGERGLLLVEDRAECYDGVHTDLGPDADVAMYSFGTIKTATCLGGGVLLVGDLWLRSRMLDRQQRWPVQTSRAYAAKLVKGAGMLALGHPRVFPRFARLMDGVTGDYDQVVRTLSRGYADHDLLDTIRRQPSRALLGMLARRLSTYDPGRVERRTRAGARLAAGLAPHVIQLGRTARRRTHWLFAVTARNPDALVAAGRAAGFDLTRGSSTLVALDESCQQASRAMATVVYLPAYDGMRDADLDTLAAVVNQVEAG